MLSGPIPHIAMYSLKDLENARAALNCCVEAFDKALPTCQDQLSAKVRAASRKVQEIESFLKMHGMIEPNPQQKLQDALENRFPNAEHRDIVEYQGKLYKLRYYPEEKCRSGWGVKKWGKRWEEIKS